MTTKPNDDVVDVWEGLNFMKGPVSTYWAARENDFKNLRKCNLTYDLNKTNV